MHEAAATLIAAVVLLAFLYGMWGWPIGPIAWVFWCVTWAIVERRKKKIIPPSS